MVAFIKQEANEKAHEIYIKAGTRQGWCLALLKVLHRHIVTLRGSWCGHNLASQNV